MQNISGAQLPSSITTAQGLEHYALSDKFVHNGAGEVYYR